MNPVRTQSLMQIRDVLARSGPEAAVQVARAAFEADRIDRLDVPEVYLALQARSEGFFEKLCVQAPGSSRFRFATA